MVAYTALVCLIEINLIKFGIYTVHVIIINLNIVLLKMLIVSKNIITYPTSSEGIIS